MGVVNEPIEDGVGDGRVADQFVPVIDRKLAGHDGRGSSMPIVEDFQEIAPLVECERCQAPVSKIRSSTRASILRRRHRTGVARDGKGRSGCRGRPYGRARRQHNSCRRQLGR
jgi:hypothetical protein